MSSCTGHRPIKLYKKNFPNLSYSCDKIFIHREICFISILNRESDFKKQHHFFKFALNVFLSVLSCWKSKYSWNVYHKRQRDENLTGCYQVSEMSKKFSLRKHNRCKKLLEKKLWSQSWTVNNRKKHAAVKFLSLCVEAHFCKHARLRNVETVKQNAC